MFLFDTRGRFKFKHCLFYNDWHTGQNNLSKIFLVGTDRGVSVVLRCVWGCGGGGGIAVPGENPSPSGGTNHPTCRRRGLKPERNGERPDCKALSQPDVGNLGFLLPCTITLKMNCYSRCFIYTNVKRSRVIEMMFCPMSRAWKMCTTHTVKRPGAGKTFCKRLTTGKNKISSLPTDYQTVSFSGLKKYFIEISSIFNMKRFFLTRVYFFCSSCFLHIILCYVIICHV